MPKITIGIPLFNNERTIKRCLLSIFAQSLQDFQIIISNDLSTDRSVLIVEELIKGRADCHLITPEAKLYYNNFPFLIHQATTEYFVWLAGDDYWEPDFLQQCLQVLEKNTTLIAAVPKCRHLYEDGTVSIADDTFSLKGHFEAKLQTFFEKGLNNNRMYGLFRTQAVKDCYPTKIMHAQDFVFTIKTLLLGDYEEVDAILMNREVTSLQKYAESVRRDHTSPFYRVFPFLPATIYILKQSDIPISRALICKLLKQNYIMHYRQVRFIYKRYNVIMGWFYKFMNERIVWRF